MQCVQVAHAAGHSSPGKDKLPEHTHVVVCVCPTEQELWALGNRMRMAGIDVTFIKEPDQPYDGQLMCLGLPPAYKSTYRRYVSNLPLLK